MPARYLYLLVGAALAWAVLRQRRAKETEPVDLPEDSGWWPTWLDW